MAPFFELLHQFTKYNNFLLEYWFLGKNLSNFVSLPWKLDTRNSSSTQQKIVYSTVCYPFDLSPCASSVFKRCYKDHDAFVFNIYNWLKKILKILKKKRDNFEKKIVKKFGEDLMSQQTTTMILFSTFLIILILAPTSHAIFAALLK